MASHMNQGYNQAGAGMGPGGFQGAGYPANQGFNPQQAPGYQPSPMPSAMGGYPPATSPQAGAPNLSQAQASAPSFGAISGYENASGFDCVPAGPPPVYQPPDQPTERPIEHFDKAAAISDDQAKEALQIFVAENCCYGKGPANDMTIKDMKASSAFHYKLETFIESRTFNWHQEPYSGGPIDGPENGPSPMPWSIIVQQPPHFQPTKHHSEIPHTANVKTCHMCRGKGHVKCKHCHGKGHEHCHRCNGEGYVLVMGDERQTCMSCNGRGHNSCTHCHGRGDTVCQECKGNGRVKTYIRLTVEWKIMAGDHVDERTALPDELITQVNGTQIFGQEFPRVFPLTSFFVQEINAASQRMVNEHSKYANANIIHRQRHNLRVVPVNEAIVSWKDKEYRFWVYGVERKVYCPDYPQQCCCGCTIL